MQASILASIFICLETNSQYNISMLNIGQDTRRPKGPSMLAAFIKLIISNLEHMQERKIQSKKQTNQN